MSGNIQRENVVVSGWDVLDEAHRVLRRTVAGVGADAWDRRTPCAEWNVTQVLQHAAGDQLGYAAAITGQGGPTENPFAPSGQLAQEPMAYLDPALNAAAAAWATVGKDVETAMTPLPLGPLPTWVGSGAAALDAAVHAWDIAVASGQPSPLTEELSRSLMAVAVEIVEPLRAFAFAPAIEPAPGDDHTTALLKYLGRRADWTA
ncbi:TIGR03086 family metal-binding protein [Asanoa sp. WMMD1127]|uniref:TIGR03086 family metal-binding protein n=1 Tax=Asanoa sp. WMMD1127 TaxID=3016107 RepID=UPI0024166FED|nr:TIGR03086 family metal-binding protein [Asanoa sp. WMMD1127]MDG4825185.1 TIGR03086 family metal-binding protein [Asanoa sp. WMMD1127]